MNVVIHYMNSHEAANEVARRCMAYGAKVLTVSADLRDKEQILRMKRSFRVMIWSRISWLTTPGYPITGFCLT